MTVCNLSRVNVLVVVTAIFLLTACSVTNEGTTRQQAEEGAQLAGTVSTRSVTIMPTHADVVEVTVNKSTYQVGERVRYTITNHGDRSVYYREGSCTWPFIVRLEDGNEVQLALNITEEEIPTRQLATGETLSCKWSQRAWSAADFGFRQVLPGPYQVKFPYAFEEEHIHSRVPSITAESQVFTIE